ncbi:MAG: nucleotide exchange factor GrpE [Armatimonadetes bacterium]|nr:nucleotide exchange factor GrpE [Armatimonadota bacterium]
MSDEKQPAGQPVEEKPVEKESGKKAGAEHEERHRGRRGAAHAAELEARVAELGKELEARDRAAIDREKEAREYLEGWQRERANFENYKKRMARELDDRGLVARVELIRSLLPAIDNLQRALGDSTTDADVVRKGVQMTLEQLMAALERQGLRQVPTEGASFDPNLHEAIEAVPGTEYEPDCIIEDLQKGYTLGDRLVRPARVRVAR